MNSKLGYELEYEYLKKKQHICLIIICAYLLIDCVARAFVNRDEQQQVYMRE